VITRGVLVTLPAQLPLMVAQTNKGFDGSIKALEASAPARRPKGLGAVGYETIAREIGDWNRFANRRQVSSFTGLCGGVSSSGNTRHLLPITKHGNVRLRTALIELAWRRVFWQKDCQAVKKWQRKKLLRRVSPKLDVTHSSAPVLPSPRRAIAPLRRDGCWRFLRHGMKAAGLSFIRSTRNQRAQRP